MSLNSVVVYGRVTDEALLKGRPARYELRVETKTAAVRVVVPAHALGHRTALGRMVLLTGALDHDHDRGHDRGLVVAPREIRFGLEGEKR